MIRCKKGAMKLLFSFCAIVATTALCAGQASAPTASTEAQVAVVTSPAESTAAPATQPLPSAPLPPSAPAPGAAPQRAAPQKPEVGNGVKPYIIGPLDVLFIRVWNNANLTGAVDVRPDGMLSLSLVGEVRADGLTVEQFKEILRMRLSEYFENNPEVDVQVVKINSKKFYIYGEVGRQGEFPLIGKTTVMDALSNAGGFRDFANPKKIYVLRGTQKFKFNYKEVSNGKNLEQNITLENGDRIFVP